MRKVIAAINLTIDGSCDHTAGIADEELHQHYNDLLSSAGAIIYGRITYQLMESHWPAVAQKPTGNKATDEFAVLIQDIPKVVFSRTLGNVGWKNARLTTRGLREEVSDLREQPGRDVLVGSPGMIDALTKLRMIDEYQLCIHPVIAGRVIPLFKSVDDRIVLKLLRTKTLRSGSVIHYYAPERAQ